MASLDELIHRLPPELFDQIKDHVFTARPSTVVIDYEYDPPHLLQVSQATREQYAKSYYASGTAFEFLHLDGLLKFIRSLTKTHCHLIECVKLVIVLPKAVSLPLRSKFRRRLITASESPLPGAETQLKLFVYGMVKRHAPLKDDAISITYDSPLSFDMGWQLRAYEGHTNWVAMMLQSMQRKPGP